jgi:MFS superfamily sulfate permease-like transporter
VSGGEWETLGNKRTLTDFFTTLRFDLVAGSTVAIVALPLALGFGVTSGAGAASGLVTAIVAGFVAGLLGGSNFQVSGPTGAMVVVLFPIIAQVGTSGLLVVGVVAGLLIVLSGLFKLGRFVELVPWSVMEGFTLGIAVVIALQQLPLILEITRGEGTETLLVAWGTIQNAAAEPLHWVVAPAQSNSCVGFYSSKWYRRCGDDDGNLGVCPSGAENWRLADQQSVHLGPVLARSWAGNHPLLSCCYCGARQY